jgi:transcriptional regulator with XRE-family HTH domain
MEVYFRKKRVEGNYGRYININNIRAEMARNNYNIADMAELMGITKPTYCALLKGSKEPSISRMAKLAQIFKMPVSHFFNFEVFE